MRRLFLLTALMLLIGASAVPGQVSAYSYGDPNMEDVAETFKTVVAAAESGDWAAAAEVHKVRRAEIVSHFSEEIAAELDRNIADKNKAELEANYKALMVMNLDRRFKNVKAQLDDYTQAKMLLAKARATFDALKPYLEGQLPTGDIAALEARFETALKAIGNPGLFGVGKAEADPKLLGENVNAIYTAVAPLFPFKGEAAAPADSGTDPAANTAADPDNTEAPAGQPAHAPMAHEDRTNAGVTIGVIGGVVVLGALAAWWARRKGIF